MLLSLYSRLLVVLYSATRPAQSRAGGQGPGGVTNMATWLLRHMGVWLVVDMLKNAENVRTDGCRWRDGRDKKAQHRVMKHATKTLSLLLLLLKKNDYSEF